MTLAPRPVRPTKLLAPLYDYIARNESATFVELAKNIHGSRRSISKTLHNGMRRGFFVLNDGYYYIAPYTVYVEKRQREKLAVSPPSVEIANIVRKAVSLNGTVPLKTAVFPETLFKRAPVAERAPRPTRVMSYYNKIYDVLETLARPARVEEIFKLLPAALMDAKTMPTRKRLRNILKQATYDGYFIVTMDREHELYSIASLAQYEAAWGQHKRVKNKPLTRGTDAIQRAVKPMARIYVAFAAGVALSLAVLILLRSFA